MLMANVVVVGAQWGDEGKGKLLTGLVKGPILLFAFKVVTTLGILLLLTGRLTNYMPFRPGGKGR